MVVTSNAQLRADYRFANDSYTGDGGYKTGSYLYEHGREYDFATRKSMASYLNLIKPTVDSQVDPVFAEPAKRSHNGGEIIDGFIGNCDNNGTNLQSVIHDATTKTVLLGNKFIVVDNFAAGQIPETKADVVEQRKYPYVYTKELWEVYDYQVDLFGKLERISFYYGLWEEGEDTQATLYKRWTKKEITTFTIDEGVDNDGKPYSTEVIRSKGDNELGVVPVVYNDKDIFTFPPFYSLSTIARSIYNTNSEIQDLERTQAFSILLLPSINMGAGQQDVVLSKDNALFFDAQASHIPSFISPDSGNMTVLMDNRDSTVETFLKSADILGSTAMGSNSTQSGVSMSYSFYGKQMKLIENSSIATYLEEQIIYIVCLYLNQNIEYDVNYPSSFAPTIAEVNSKVEILRAVADLQISDEVGAQMYSNIIDIVGEFMGTDSDDIDKMKQSALEYTQVVSTVDDEE